MLRPSILEISKELIYVLTAAILIFSLLESVWPGVVSAYLNMNWLLILWLVDGILLLALSEKNHE